ncbi:2-hydroxymuconate tautomerase [Cupriavidus taiwanensis]|uniref:2-hydroxymuconate tautomerase n=1 Tax=Cupriavidus taiwanensis TaxID=164546 RepID=UPI0025B684A2|nr:2-hydroxymuconate tautomerase [Cupriavidus taiwanensis]
MSARSRCASPDPAPRTYGKRRHTMPILQVFLIEGRTDEQKARLIRALTDAAVEAVGAPVETVRVMITEVPKTQFGIGGTTAKALGR